MKALYSAATGMAAQQVNIDNTSNNLANVNTTGFKRGEATFQDLIYVNEIVPGAVAAQGQYVPTGLQIGSGTQVSGITKIFSEGNLVNTSNPLDIAIQGDGFLQYFCPTANCVTPATVHSVLTLSEISSTPMDSCCSRRLPFPKQRSPFPSVRTGLSRSSTRARRIPRRFSAS